MNIILKHVNIVYTMDHTGPTYWLIYLIWIHGMVNYPYITGSETQPQMLHYGYIFYILNNNDCVLLY